MAHVRQQIRDAIKEKLIGSIAATEGRVYSSRVYPVDTLPAVSIYIDTDTVEVEQGAIGDGVLNQMRLADIRVEVRDRAALGVDDSLDDICISIEESLAGDLTLSGIANYVSLINTEFEYDGEGSAPAIVATMRYQCLYRISALDPETPIQ